MLDREVQAVRFPWLAYLSQPIGHPTVKIILNPVKFKKLYHVWLLEMCWMRENIVVTDLHK